MRTTAQEVRDVLDNTELIDSQIEAYITSAEVLVTQVLGTTLDESVLAEIERWLTAHMIASTRERQAKKEEAGTAKIEYNGQFKGGLESTTYGQMVLLLDTTGAMANASKGLQSAYIRAVPTSYPLQ